MLVAAASSAGRQRAHHEQDREQPGRKAAHQARNDASECDCEEAECARRGGPGGRGARAARTRSVAEGVGEWALIHWGTWGRKGCNVMWPRLRVWAIAPRPPTAAARQPVHRGARRGTVGRLHAPVGWWGGVYGIGGWKGGGGGVGVFHPTPRRAAPPHSGAMAQHTYNRALTGFGSGCDWPCEGGFGSLVSGRALAGSFLVGGAMGGRP